MSVTDEPELQHQRSTLKNVSSTRLSTRDDACQALRNNWQNILHTLQSIEQETTQKPVTRSEARDLITKMNSLETAFIEELWEFILQRLNDTNKKLQSIDTDLRSVVQLYDSMIKLLESTLNQYDYVKKKRLRTYKNNGI